MVIFTHRHMCIYEYFYVGAYTYVCVVILNIGVASLFIGEPKAVSKESEVRHFYFSVLTSTSKRICFCLVLVATRNVDRTTELPSLFLINILHDRQKLTKEPS